MRLCVVYALAIVAVTAGACQSADVAQECSVEFVTTESRLRYRDIVCGEGEIAQAGSTVTVDYAARLPDGPVFDSTARSGPVQVPIGGTRIIQGFEEAVAGMRVGGTREVVVPPDLAYGRGGFPPFVPPSTPITFEIELVRTAER